MSKAISREVLRRLYGHDASHYLIYPDEVLTARSLADVEQALATARTPVTFRSGGTSLSGQSLGTGTVIDTRSRFQKVSVSGNLVECEPGATVAYVNARLRRHGRMLGPDPASEIAATIGGVVSNNSSGMACGTEFNTYSLLDSLVFTLPSGLTIDSADDDSDDQLRTGAGELYATLERIRDEIRGDDELTALLRHHFSMKNTIGYGLNSFLDFDRPIDIFTHLLVGAEGTLAFISTVRMATVPIYPHISCALAVFDTLDDAARSIGDLKEAGAHTIELMDGVSLKVAQSLDNCPAEIFGLEIDDQCALLIELRAEDPSHLAALEDRASQALQAHAKSAPFTRDPVERAQLWVVRKGLYAACAGHRPAGTTALLEDIVVPVPALAHTCRELQNLTRTYGYPGSVIFGHAKDGNLHFMITDDFSSDEALAKLDAFTTDLVDLVLEMKGNLKAEHGTGRAMAPFVERQYGARLTGMMWDIKRAADPRMILNPGVILSDDPTAHITSVKDFPLTNEIVDRCVECGYCEPACPSKNLTLTPRQRIILGREIEMAKSAGDTELVATLEAAYPYAALETCAVDGLCGTACPVSINTGDLVRAERAQANPALWQGAWSLAGASWSTFTRLASAALTAAKHVPTPMLKAMTAAGQAIIGPDKIPAWSPDIPSGGSSRYRDDASDRLDAIYIPSCLGALFESESTILEDDLLELASLAGLNLHVPAQIDSLCCSTPWSSKGLKGKDAMVNRLATILTDQSRSVVPVVCDASSCTEGIMKAVRDRGLEVLDAPTFVVRYILPALDVPPPAPTSLTLHPTCSSTQLGSFDDVVAIARLIAQDVEVPENWGCCAFAGDRGLLHPELTASATQREAETVAELNSDLHASSNRTCEMGMSRATGQTYHSIISLLADHVRSAHALL